MTKYKICPVCNNYSPLRLTKKHTEYYQCTSCKTLFSDPLENSGMVGGKNEVPRNKEQNHLRISRIDNLVKGINKESVRVLDFGCGTGYLIADLNEAGYACDGYDAYNPDYAKLPENNKYNVCTMIEVAEHCSKPFFEFDCIYRSLVKGGFLMVESSYVNVAEQDNIPLEDFEYIEPSVGHATIFSHHGLDLLLALKGFTPLSHIDRHVRLYLKR